MTLPCRSNIRKHWMLEALNPRHPPFPGPNPGGAMKRPRPESATGKEPNQARILIPFRPPRPEPGGR